MDETYIYSFHTHLKSWSDYFSQELFQPVSKRLSLIILNAANENGFIANASLRFKPKSNRGDYHG